MKKIKDYIQFYSIALWLISPLLLAIVIVKQQSAIYQLKQPVIVYQVDNAGGAMFGKITDKEIIEGRYTVTAGAYGKFLVTEEQYEDIEVGDDIPDYLKQRGMESNVPGGKNE